MKIMAWVFLILSGIIGLTSRFFISGGSSNCPTECSQWLIWDRISCESCKLIGGLISQTLSLAYWGLIGVSVLFMLLAWWQYTKR